MYPKLAKEWNYNKNVKLPSEFMAGSGKKVWWKCSEDHGKKKCKNCGV